MQARPLSQRVTESLFQIAAEYEELLGTEIGNHKNTLRMVQALKRGELSLDRLVVSDDGWQVMPEEEEADGSPNGAAEDIGEPARVG